MSSLGVQYLQLGEVDGDSVNVIGELRAHETGHQHIEAFGFGMSQQ